MSRVPVMLINRVNDAVIVKSDSESPIPREGETVMVCGKRYKVAEVINDYGQRILDTVIKVMMIPHAERR